MANRALNELGLKAREQAGYAVALGIGWLISIPICVVSAQNADWGWLAFGALLHAFCSSWFFVWFFYAQMSQLFFMNAAAVVEAIEKQNIGSPETADTSRAFSKRIPDGNPVSNFLSGEKTTKSSNTVKLKADPEALEIIDDGLLYWCRNCNATTEIRKNGSCLNGHFGSALLSYPGAQKSEVNYCQTCKIVVYGQKRCNCPKCAKETTWEQD